MDLEEKIREIQAQLEEERRKREKVEADREKAEADREKAEADKEKATQKSTLEEFLRYWEENVCPPEVQEKALSTQGATVKPDNRYRPDDLKKWPNFTEEQADIAAKLTKIVPAGDRKFSRLLSCQDQGRILKPKKVGSEKDIEDYLFSALQTPVEDIMRVIQEDYSGNAPSQLKVGNSFRYDSHLNSISEIERSRIRGNRPRFDKACFVAFGADSSTMTCIVEHKAPHKLTGPVIQAGLKETDLLSIIQRVEVPPKENEEACFSYRAEKLVMTVITQVYDYMIRSGVRYGYITTGLAYIFLKFDRDCPGILYYHLAEGDSDIANEGEQDKETADQDLERALCRTRVGRVVLHILVAIQSEPYTLAERNRLLELPRWCVDDEKILEGMDSSSSPDIPSSSPYRESEHHEDVQRSPRVLRDRCRPDESLPMRTPSRSPSPSDCADSDTRQSRKRTLSTLSPSHQSNRGESNPISDPPQKRSYCTHKCLQGVCKNGKLDQACPNYSSHVRNLRNPERHQIDCKVLCSEVSSHIQANLNDYDKPLAKTWNSCVYEITEPKYGYKFVGKGSYDKSLLKEERDTYRELLLLQGDVIPVYIGLISLSPLKLFFNELMITSMMLMSWAGDKSEFTREEKYPILQALLKNGVEQMDGHDGNFGRNPLTKKIMAFDFGNVKKRKPILSQRVIELKGKNGLRKRKRHEHADNRHDNCKSHNCEGRCACKARESALA